MLTCCLDDSQTAVMSPLTDLTPPQKEQLFQQGFDVQYYSLSGVSLGKGVKDD